MWYVVPTVNPVTFRGDELADNPDVFMTHVVPPSLEMYIVYVDAPVTALHATETVPVVSWSAVKVGAAGAAGGIVMVLTGLFSDDDVLFFATIATDTVVPFDMWVPSDRYAVLVPG